MSGRPPGCVSTFFRPVQPWGQGGEHLKWRPDPDAKASFPRAAGGALTTQVPSSTFARRAHSYREGG